VGGAVGQPVAERLQLAQAEQPGARLGAGPGAGDPGAHAAGGDRGGELALQARNLLLEGAPRGPLVDLDCGKADLGERGDLRAFDHCGHRQPPIGARGLAPQNTWVPSIPMRCTSTMLSTMDFAVAVPTPTGPPLAV
jgi:hypothetical protein